MVVIFVFSVHCFLVLSPSWSIASYKTSHAYFTTMKNHFTVKKKKNETSIHNIWIYSIYKPCTLSVSLLLITSTSEFINLIPIQWCLVMWLLYSNQSGTKDQIPNIRWIIKKVRVPEKHLLWLYDYAKAFECLDHNKLWDTLQEMGLPDHLTCLLRNLQVRKQQLEPDTE